MTIVDKPKTENTLAPATPGARLSRPQIVGGGVLILIGALWLLERAGALDISVTAVLALATLVVGISLMLLANEGSHVGLVVFGTVLGLVALVTAAAPFEGFQGGVGERVIEVSSVDGIHPDYNLAMGNLIIDLTEIADLRAETPLSASVGMGELVIRVPEGTEIRVDVEIGAGQLEIFGRVTDGLGIAESYETPGFAASSESLTLDLQAFTGRVEVTDE